MARVRPASPEHRPRPATWRADRGRGTRATVRRRPISDDGSSRRPRVPSPAVLRRRRRRSTAGVYGACGMWHPARSRGGKRRSRPPFLKRSERPASRSVLDELRQPRPCRTDEAPSLSATADSFCKRRRHRRALGETTNDRGSARWGTAAITSAEVWIGARVPALAVGHQMPGSSSPTPVTLPGSPGPIRTSSGSATSATTTLWSTPSPWRVTSAGTVTAPS